MANHKSALKRCRQNEIRRMRNKSIKTQIKNVTHKVNLAVSEHSKEEAIGNLNMAKSSIDRAGKAGAIHKRTAARKISRLTRRVNSMAV